MIDQKVLNSVLQAREDIEHIRQDNERAWQEIRVMKARIKFMEIVMTLFSIAVIMRAIVTLMEMF